MASPGMQTMRVTLRPAARGMHMRDPRFRAVDAAALDAMMSARPLRPPAGQQLAERTMSPGQLEAKRDQKRAAAAGRASRLMSGHIDGDHHRDGLSVVAPRAELSASQETA